MTARQQIAETLTASDLDSTVEEVDDRVLAEEFAQRVLDLYTGGMLSFMIELGHRTGLLDAAAAGPATSEELADRAGVQERYVREWAGALATGGILDYDAKKGTFHLPDWRGVCLTGGGSANVAPLSQLVSSLGARLPQVARAFVEGGGVPYSEYRPDFTGVMDSIGRGTYDELLLDAFLPLAGDLPDRLASGIRVADLGCGTGHCVNLMAAAYPASEFWGFDIAEDAIARGRDEASAQGLSNVTFEVRDVAALTVDRLFDAVFAFDAIHDQADPAGVLRRAHDALAPGGWFVMVDIKAASALEDNLAHPFAPFLYSISTLHCLPVSLAQAGAGLGTVWGEQLARRMLADAGFVDIVVHDAPGDPLDLVYVCRRASTA